MFAKSSTEHYSESIDTKLLGFVDSVIAMKDEKAVTKRKYTIGNVSENHAQIIEKILRTELGSIADVSQYINARQTKSDNGQELNMKSNDFPQPTSKTQLDGDATNQSISQNPEKSTDFSKKIRKFSGTDEIPFEDDVRFSIGDGESNGSIVVNKEKLVTRA